ncbi:UV-endonuclease UvdE-domain-containing protein [Pyronema domesticum]|nr:UV-endonuclease UvdE-domain-containing protein [Pyronema domesticum]
MTPKRKRNAPSQSLSTAILDGEPDRVGSPADIPGNEEPADPSILSEPPTSQSYVEDDSDAFSPDHEPSSAESEHEDYAPSSPEVTKKKSPAKKSPAKKGAAATTTKGKGAAKEGDGSPEKKKAPPRKKMVTKTVIGEEGEEMQIREEEERQTEREPQWNTEIVPIPWKGRIGYACLNTYLRTSFPPIFCSRTCRIDTILKQGDFKTHGLPYIQGLSLDNVRDLSKIIRWNEKYNIKFLRVSSEMFPFASHPKYGYDLEFAKEELENAGRLAMEYGHRLTTHPGQFTQLGSPRKEVIEASKKDLEYHSQMLKGLGMTGQSDRDAVMILHMGGMFGDKGETLQRFRDNYKTLSEDVKNRLVLENDDVIWSVHDLLPICEELNIPMVLDYHHHNIIHDPSLRAGTLDILPLLPRIAATWSKKNITQKQHYSEPCEGAITGREMRKHSPRVAVLPPCDPTMDLMIEAKDKEQAVFELYKTYNICGYSDGLFNEVIPHKRTDDNRPGKKLTKKQIKEGMKEEVKDEVPEDEVGMGGSERRVYWPLGCEHWLSPEKRVINRKPKDELEDGEIEAEPKKPSPKKRSPRKGKTVKDEEEMGVKAAVNSSPVKKPARKTRKKAAVKEEDEAMEEAHEEAASSPAKKPARKPRGKKAIKAEEVDEAQSSPAKPTRTPRKKALVMKSEEPEDSAELNMPMQEETSPIKATLHVKGVDQQAIPPSAVDSPATMLTPPKSGDKSEEGLDDISKINVRFNSMPPSPVESELSDPPLSDSEENVSGKQEGVFREASSWVQEVEHSNVGGTTGRRRRVVA